MKRYTLVAFVVSLFLLTACNSSTTSGEDTATMPTVQSIEAITQSPVSEIATLTPSTFNTLETLFPATQTPTPKSVTPNVTITPSLEPSLTPTVPENPEYRSLSELLEPNNGCELPCWWEVIPGQSTIDSAKALLNPPIFQWWDEYTVVAVDLNAGTSVLIELQSESTMINVISVGGRRESEGFGQAWRNYSLYEVLNRYGLPSDVYIYYPWRPDSGTAPMYRLFLFYKQLGIEIDYLGQATETNDDDGKSTVCPNLEQVQEINLLLYQPGQIENIIEVAIPPVTVSFIAESDTVYDLIEWSLATETSIEAFYDTFSSSPEGESCFEFLTYW